MLKNKQKSGSEATTSEPLFISTALFDLLAALPLTLLLIGGRFRVAQALIIGARAHQTQ